MPEEWTFVSVFVPALYVAIHGKRTRSPLKFNSMAKILTHRQESAGGVVFRRQNGRIDVILIAVGDGEQRWQLPKGLVEKDEAPATTARREVREETGVDATLVGPLDTIEYWYYGKTRGNKRIRFHKFVHFFLFHYQSGHTADHDHEVQEARWVGIEEAGRILAFKNEKDIVAKARQQIESA